MDKILYLIDFSIIGVYPFLMKNSMYFFNINRSTCPELSPASCTWKAQKDSLPVHQWQERPKDMLRRNLPYFAAHL
jgi:hypothetical protein